MILLSKPLSARTDSPTSPWAPSSQTFRNQQGRSSWREAVCLLIQLCVRAQFSIHLCHIIILSFASTSGCPLKELTVWGVKRDRDWYTEIHLRMRTVTQTQKRIPARIYLRISTENPHSHFQIHLTVALFLPYGWYRIHTECFYFYICMLLVWLHYLNHLKECHVNGNAAIESAIESAIPAYQPLCGCLISFRCSSSCLF